jgi:hypothetical protein
MFALNFDQWTVRAQIGPLPELFADYLQGARLVDKIDDGDGETCVLVLYRHARDKNDAGGKWLAVVQRYEPYSSGFFPAALITANGETLFVGAGERLLAYDLRVPKRLWEDRAYCGFWSWRQHGEFVVMSAELEFAAWTGGGEKLWSTFVEPPWHYSVEAGRVSLNVMGQISEFPIADGPPKTSQSE